MLKKETIALQAALAQFCRDGKVVNIEGALPDRLPHYRRLVYNVMYGLLTKAYPIARSILSEEEFRVLLDDFLLHNDAQTPEVWKVPGEFCDFVHRHKPSLTETYPFLCDLLLMEWTEINVFNSPENDMPVYEEVFPEKTDKAAVNPDHEILTLTFPVHKGGWEGIAEKAGKYNLLIFRNVKSKKVHFVALSDLHKALLHYLIRQRSTDESILSALGDFDFPSEPDLVNRLFSFLEQQFQEGLILGRITDQ